MRLFKCCMCDKTIHEGSEFKMETLQTKITNKYYFCSKNCYEKIFGTEKNK